MGQLTIHKFAYLKARFAEKELGNYNSVVRRELCCSQDNWRSLLEFLYLFEPLSLRYHGFSFSVGKNLLGITDYSVKYLELTLVKVETVFFTAFSPI